MLYLYFDGGSINSPNIGGWGCVLYDSDMNYVDSDYGSLDKTTNNEAEYIALIQGLKLASKYYTNIIHVYGDSLLVIKQLQKKWKCNQKHLIDLRDEALEYINTNETILHHIPRSKNKEADKLANRGINEIYRSIKLNSL